MSVRVMAWVWSESESTSTARFVLLAIADAANDAGAEAYPSMATLVKKTRLSDRGVQKAIKTLVDLGELVVYPNAGPKGCNKYRIVMRTPEPGSPPNQVHHPEPDAGGQGSPPNVVPSTPEPGSPPPPNVVRTNHPLPVLEPKKTSSRSSRPTAGTRIPDDFAATAEMIAWARRETPLVGAKETEAFVDYWRGKPGTAGRKTDWVATWRNWMRRAQTDAERGRPRAAPASDGLVDFNGHRVRPEFPSRAAVRDRMAALDAAREQQAIEGSAS